MAKEGMNDAQTVEKSQEQDFREEDVQDENGHIKFVQGSKALALAKAKDPPRPRSRNMIQLYLICAVAYMCSSLNGYDGSLMGNMLVMPTFDSTFDVSIDGAKAGLITGIYTIGSVCALPFIGPVTDKFGRRGGIFCGCAFVIIGTIIEGTTSFTGSLGQFMAGRFFLGFGCGVAAAAAPTYVVEISHPAYRGTMTGLYNTIYNVGSIAAAGCLRGAINYPDNRAWVIPTWIQMVFSTFVCFLIFLLPESPRWLYTHGHQEKAYAILTKYHGEGNPDNVFVKLQMAEFVQELELDGADKRWWDYRVLFNSPAARYRVFCLSIVSVFSQLCGNGVSSYFMPAFLATAGVTDPITVLNINLGTSFAGFFFSITGAFMVERVGRRKLIFYALCVIALFWVLITICTGVYSDNGQVGAADSAILFVNLFGVAYSIGITPLQALEVLSYEQRAKGMAFSSVMTNVALLVNQFGMPVALANIGYHTYIVFIFWDVFEAAIVYFFLVETKGRTLEELNAVFKAKNPRKASLAIKKVDLDQSIDEIPSKEV